MTKRATAATKARLEREIASAVAKPSSGRAIGTALPAATLTQRLAAMSTAELMFTARGLATRTDAGSDKACTAVLEALESRVSGPSFEAFVAEIYAT